MKIKHILSLFLIIGIIYLALSFITKGEFMNTSCTINNVNVSDMFHSDVASFNFKSGETVITLSSGEVVNTNESVICSQTFGTVSILHNTPKEALIGLVTLIYLTVVVYHFTEYQLWKEYDKGFKQTLTTTFWLFLMPFLPFTMIAKHKLKE